MAGEGSSEIRTELVFIPSPGVGHLGSAVEMARQLVDRNDRLSIAILVMKFPFDRLDITASLSSSRHAGLIRLIDLPPPPPPPAQNGDVSPTTPSSPAGFLSRFVHSHIPQVRAAVSQLVAAARSPPLGGFILDMFCASMMDVADEFGVPSYIFFTSGAAFLGLMLHLQVLRDRDSRDIAGLNKEPSELAVPAFENPFPTKLLPNIFLDKNGGGSEFALSVARRIRSTKGIMVNTFEALEAHALGSLRNQEHPLPPIYPVGPVVKLETEEATKRNGDESHVMGWLDGQPDRSVVFLCFGSMGSFPEEQVKEIAVGLERSGHRFLWSLRRPPQPDKIGYPSSYADPAEVLPEGFSERTAGTGKVIGWAPQVAVLSHPAVGGFVSHCGWNSTLESLWCGVPVATWPLGAEQQMNAFLMTREVGLAAEMTLEYMKDLNGPANMVLGAGAIEKGVSRLMGREGDEVREKVEEMTGKARKAVAEGGSSYVALGSFIDSVMDNIAA